MGAREASLREPTHLLNERCAGWTFFWRALKGLKWMLVSPRVRPPHRIEAVKYSFARPDAPRHWSMALKNTGFKSRAMCVFRAVAVVNTGKPYLPARSFGRRAVLVGLL